MEIKGQAHAKVLWQAKAGLFPVKERFVWLGHRMHRGQRGRQNQIGGHDMPCGRVVIMLMANILLNVMM